ncbi:putative PurR-regulated permease PerM [Salinibacter ruber]|uniref:AI-2E family transporter n=1 Tax=Salinibacter ruber TaxID=146919 RepID=UPI002073A0B6|nr:AI-2E family transporter [Salinibacter ruber]MCS3630606.1 putative PurR-regulated permease PerM [Salinibacter ruber]MCS3705098.1 putative PurR-regulated permease PerM [Salinibacter ruber]MCS4102253.1 putative PurR-regulated permease PerM [Salinibacter ruber]
MPDGPDPSSSGPDESPGSDPEEPSSSETAPARHARTTTASRRGHARERMPVSPDESASTFTFDRVVRFLLGAAAVGSVGWMVWYFAGIVLYLIVGGLLAYLLRPPVDYIQGLGVGRVPAILVAFAVFLGVIVVIVTSVVPFITRQVQDLSQLITIDTAAYVANLIEAQVQGVVPLEQGVLEENVRQAAESLMRGDLVEGQQVAETVSSVVSVFTNIVYAVVIVPFVTFFLLKDELRIRRSLLHLVPNRYFEVTLSILAKVELNIGRYFRALLVQGTAIAVIASTLLWIVGLRGAIAIGIFTGLANTIPYFGPFLGFLAGTLVGIAQTGDVSLVPGVALAMALTQLADNVLLQPLIFSRAAQTHPLVILFVVLAGAQLGGILGMLMAIPLTTTLRVIVEQLLWSLRNYRILRAG